ncbi:HD domain-containing protein [Chitinophaga pollutisoli]|uniref:HD domain-containing protein n=1 Tax=Chitinophaga pollutisoli TaxID=3133966 RepID=A0ABZ2YN81_9BACT
MHEILQTIEAFTDKAHGDQMRKYTPRDRYIVHPMRVMRICEAYTQSLPVLAAAILHDVLEDTAVTKSELSSFLSSIMPAREAERTLQLVVELTDVYIKKNYPEWNRRKRKSAELKRILQNSPDAQTIKYADILDNCQGMSEQDTDFAPVFLRECRQLLKLMHKGNPELKARTEAVVMDELAALERKS